ncbi:MAG: DUF2071 domain-containing protein [Vulcanimicrobiaceae bacterium]
MNGPSVLDMWWRDILTAHWRADAGVLAKLLPAGVEIERYDGDAWLTIVPFRMTAVRLRCAPALPGFTSVRELNLRTYVRAGGRPGVYFFSLDADSPALVAAARCTTGLPYLNARMAFDTTSEDIVFSSVRTHRGIGSGRFRARYRASGDVFEARPGTLEHFLHERSLFFVRRAKTLFAGEVRHAPWRLQRATIEIAENTLGSLASHALEPSPAHTFFTSALHVRAAAVLPVSVRRARGA